MDITKLVATLHPLERRVVPVLNKETELEGIAKASDLSIIEVMRALQWLANKKVLGLKEQVNNFVDLDENGKVYAKKGLPESQLLKEIKDEPKSSSSLSLSREEVNSCIGVLKQKAAIELKKEGSDLIISITDQGKKLLEKPTLEEQFISQKFPVNIDNLKDEEKLAYRNLLKRKGIIKPKQEKIKSVELTDLGKKLTKQKIDDKDIIDRLTPEMIKSGEWKNKTFRSYDVSINVPKISGGRRHFTNEVIEYAKRIWLDLGFKEMTGNITQTSFWNFDALFVPQDHPAREMQDTFFVKNPAQTKIQNKKVLDVVKAIHENGGNTKSKGWGYKWSPEEAMRNVLRTHTTVLSAQTIAQIKKSDLPAKFFALGKCFRNETLDHSHLFEFNQVEGIVVDPNANFRHLLGYLREFFSKMGYPKVRIRPAYFPYTEPSAEVDVYDPYHKKWIELAGAGIFRPEVVEPLLGEAVPVLAWGLGFARILPEYYGITDIRDLYKNDIKKLRHVKTWLR